MSYSIHEHQHRFAAWAASRGSSVSGSRFTVEQGRDILERSGFTPEFRLPRTKPDKEQVDKLHKEWRTKVKKATRNYTFTHGVAAKLINIYLKVRFVVGDHQHPWVHHLHPPIDSLLLERLYLDDIGGSKSEWKRLAKKRWSNFGSRDYQKAIDHMRMERKHLPLWSIEEYWKGHQ